jgi:hypothetical protein
LAKANPPTSPLANRTFLQILAFQPSSEVHAGPYLDEDSIVRLEIVYRRDSGEEGEPKATVGELGDTVRDHLG